jgi:hypothetical protein
LRAAVGFPSGKDTIWLGQDTYGKNELKFNKLGNCNKPMVTHLFAKVTEFKERLN